MEEITIWTGRPSLWIGFRTYFWCCLLSLVFLIASIVKPMFLLIILLLALMAVIRVYRIKATKYDLTSQRLRITSGILSRKIAEVELFRIRDISFQQSFMERLLSIGAVKVVSTDQDNSLILLAGIKNAMQVKEDVRKYVMESRRQSGTRDLDVSSVWH